MTRPQTALTVFLYGCGIFVLVVGLFTDAYDWELGAVGLGALWVLASTLQSFFATWNDLNAFTVLLLGSGILALIVGLLTDAYDWKYGVVALVALWVLALTLRVFCTSRREEYDNPRLRRFIDRYD